MDAKRAVEIAQAESEATRGEPLPEEAPGERRKALGVPNRNPAYLRGTASRGEAWHVSGRHPC
jgi:hypothetical protein